jgi:hypothetical protein
MSQKAAQSLPSPANDLGFNLGAGPGGRDLPPARWPTTKSPDSQPIATESKRGLGVSCASFVHLITLDRRHRGFVSLHKLPSHEKPAEPPTPSDGSTSYAARGIGREFARPFPRRFLPQRRPSTVRESTSAYAVSSYGSPVFAPTAEGRRANCAVGKHVTAPRLVCVVIICRRCSLRLRCRLGLRSRRARIVDARRQFHSRAEAAPWTCPARAHRP